MKLFASQPSAGWLSAFALQFGLFGSVAAQAPVLQSVSPVRNATAASLSSPLTGTFSQPLAAGSINGVRVFSQQAGGRKAGTATLNGPTLAFAPTAAFRPGETVSATFNTAVQSVSGQPLATPQVVQFTTAAGRAQGVFGSITALPAGIQPTGVTAGDVDGDGDLDLLAANSNMFGMNPALSSVMLFRNSGTGTFAAPTTVFSGGNPLKVVLADVDGDGDLDMLTSLNANAQVDVRLNNGTGTFTAAAPVSVQNGPARLVAADLNADGNLDLVVLNSVGGGASNTISIRFGNGAGAFTGSVNLPNVHGSIDLAVGDVDSDGDLDLLLPTGLGASVDMRRNDGTGTFGSITTIATGNAPVALALGDIDRDGDLDVVTAEYSTGSSTASVRLNNGTGTFSGTTQVALNGFGPLSMKLADLDGDGDLDLLVAHTEVQSTGNLGRVTIHLNDGSGTFASPSAAFVGLAPYEMTVADLNNDGTLDLATANLNDNTLSVRFNAPVLTATRTNATAASLMAWPNPVAAGQPLTVRLPAAAGGSLTLYSALGQAVHQVVATGPQAELPTQGLAPGVYSLVARQPGQVPVARRLVVER